MVVFPLSCSCGTHYNVELPESELLRHVPTRWLDWHWLDRPPLAAGRPEDPAPEAVVGAVAAPVPFSCTTCGDTVDVPRRSQQLIARLLAVPR